jgi:hypothetical protein
MGTTALCTFCGDCHGDALIEGDYFDRLGQISPFTKVAMEELHLPGF